MRLKMQSAIMKTKMTIEEKGGVNPSFLKYNQLIINILYLSYILMKTKIISLKAKPEENTKLDLDTCKRILNAGESEYSDQEIIRIRDYLYQLAEIECRYFKQWQTEQNDNVIPINANNNERKESIPLYPGEHRRTG